MSRYGTKFVETEALLAALDGNAEALGEIIGDMNAMEQRELARACDRLKNELWYTLAKDKVSDDE